MLTQLPPWFNPLMMSLNEEAFVFLCLTLAVMFNSSAARETNI